MFGTLCTCRCGRRPRRDLVHVGAGERPGMHACAQVFLLDLGVSHRSPSEACRAEELQQLREIFRGSPGSEKSASAHVDL